MARRQKSLHFNLQEGENVIFHREHRSKRGRNRWNKSSTDIFYKKKREMDELRQGVDKKSLQYIQMKYKI